MYVANKIHDNLYQGGFPPGGDTLSKGGIDVLVLCAADNQNASWYEGIEVILAPGDDTESWPPNPHHIDAWENAAKQVADRVKRGQNVLVTCMAGHNRSGIVVGLSLCLLLGITGEEAVKTVRSRREHALNNVAFSRYIIERFG